MKNSLITVVITTRNEKHNIMSCLASLKRQTYKQIEIIVVDNNSTDDTFLIAKQFTPFVFTKGPERSVQRNYGVKKGKGEYVLILDADMILEPTVIEECIKKIKEDNKIVGIYIPEESVGEGFWARCKTLERSFYIGVDWIEAARFYRKNIFLEFGGFDEHITGPEDWDLSQRIASKYPLGRIESKILHNEGRLSFSRTVSKKYYYAKKFTIYAKKMVNKEHYAKQSNILERYKLYLSRPEKLLANPVLSIGMLFMKSSEYAAAGTGLLLSKLFRK